MTQPIENADEAIDILAPVKQEGNARPLPDSGALYAVLSGSSIKSGTHRRGQVSGIHVRISGGRSGRESFAPIVHTGSAGHE